MTKKKKKDREGTAANEDKPWGGRGSILNLGGELK